MKKSNQTGIPKYVISFIPIIGPFFNSAYKYIFETKKKLANKSHSWRINLLLQLISDVWKNIASYVKKKIELSCFRNVEYITLKALLDDTILLVLNIYITIFRSGN